MALETSKESRDAFVELRFVAGERKVTLEVNTWTFSAVLNHKQVVRAVGMGLRKSRHAGHRNGGNGGQST
jgi:hypothetical protein